MQVAANEEAFSDPVNLSCYGILKCGNFHDDLFLLGTLPSEVLLMASQLSSAIGYSLNITVNTREVPPPPETAGRSRQAEMEKEAKMRNKTARAAMRAKSREETPQGETGPDMAQTEPSQ